MGTNVVLDRVPTEDAAVGYTVYDSSGSGSSGSGSEADSVSSQRWETSVDGDHWTPVAGATAPTFTPGDAQVGRFLRVVVQVDGNSRESDEVRVANVNDAPGGTLAISGTAKQGETIAVADAVADADGIPDGARAYHWHVQGDDGGWIDIPGATGAAFTLTEAEVGRAVQAVLIYTDGRGTVERVETAATAAVANVDDEPHGSLTINGEAAQSATLTLTDAVTDADGMSDPGRGYEWQVQDENGDWTTLPGGRGAAFTLTQAEVGRPVRAVMSYVDDHGNREWVVANPTAAVANANNAPRGGVAIVGTAKQGEVLSLVDTVTDADGWLGFPGVAGLFTAGDAPAFFQYEPEPVELGVRFTSASGGAVTGLRFYKAPGDTGTQVGQLWTAAGTLLATAAFTDETASGWQQVDFAAPVSVEADASYTNCPRV